MAAEQQKLNDSTICLHPDTSLDSSSSTGYGSKALWLASVYDFHSITDYQSAPYVYRRYGFPNSDDLASTVAALEAAEAGLATSTGMGAIVAAVLAVCKAGDLAILNTDSYGATYEFFDVDLRRFGINVEFENVHDVKQLERVIKRYLVTEGNLKEESMDGVPKKNVAVFVESISNPLIRVADLHSIADICKKNGAVLIVDNTMATPLRFKPILEGADLVVHSATKFLGGHSDLMAGVLVGAASHILQATKLATRWGLTVSSFDAWLAIRSIQSLQVRVEYAWASAATLAERILASRLVLRVMSAYKCAIVSIEVPGGFEGANRAIKAFKLIRLSPSFGGTSTTVSHSATSSHKFLPAEQRQQLGITDGLLRISVGLENVEDIWADLKQGLLAAVGARFPTI